MALSKTKKKAVLRYHIWGRYSRVYYIGERVNGYSSEWHTVIDARGCAADGLKAFLNGVKEGDRVKVALYRYSQYCGYYLQDTCYFDMVYTENVKKANQSSGVPSFRDFQKKRVYRMEDRWFRRNGGGPDRTVATEQQIESGINMMCAMLGIAERPRVMIDSQLTKTSRREWNMIRLASSWGGNQRILIHEFAHWVHAKIRNRDGISHGRQFVSILVALNNWFLPGWKSVDPADLCEDNGVKYCPETYLLVDEVLAGAANHEELFSEATEVYSPVDRRRLMEEIDEKVAR